MSDTKSNEHQDTQQPAARIVEDQAGNALAILPKEIANQVDNGEVGGTVEIAPREQERTQERRAGRDREAEDDLDDDRDTSGGGRSDYNSNRNKLKRERRKRAQERDKGHIEQLTHAVVSQGRMIQALTRGQQQTALATLEKEAQDAKTAYAEAQRRYKEAIDAGNGSAATEAQTVMNNASSYYSIVAAKHTELSKQLIKAPEADDGADDQGGEPARRDRGNEGPPRLTRAQAEKMEDLKDDFLERHPYVDPTDNSPGQRAIRALDADIAAEGFKPYTQDYWDELGERIVEAGLDREDRRMRQQNNDRDRGRQRDDDPDDPGYDMRQRGRAHQRREYRERDRDDDVGGPPTGGAGRGRGGGDVEVHLTPAMRKGLADSGIPETGGDAKMIQRRNRILASYANIPSQR